MCRLLTVAPQKKTKAVVVRSIGRKAVDGRAGETIGHAAAVGTPVGTYGSSLLLTTIPQGTRVARAGWTA